MRAALLLLLVAFAAHATPAQHIVSLAPHLTELAFTAGAGDRIVATVEYSDHPDAARGIPRIGNAFRVDLERLVALRPDAVLVWESGTPVPTVERIRALGLPVVSFQTQRLEHVATVLRQIGRLAGTSEIAERAATDYEHRIQELRDRYRNRAPVSVFIEVDDRPLYTVNGKQIISEIVELCGGHNVFADLNELAPAIGIEAVIAANPQAIISTDDTVPDAAASWKRWSHIEAVRTGNVYTLRSDDIARATTRLTVAAESVCRTLDTARQRLR
ncbi:MAG TPA: cobalamin-binding protein [Steroidobacteraceae bacterium]|jgi:iron complex transport system substrate-binding protein